MAIPLSVGGGGLGSKSIAAKNASSSLALKDKFVKNFKDKLARNNSTLVSSAAKNGNHDNDMLYSTHGHTSDKSPLDLAKI